MKRWVSGALALGVSALWFSGTAPPVYEWLLGLRDQAGLVASGTATPVGEGHADETGTAAVLRLHAMSELWPSRVASVLTAEQRATGHRMAMTAPEVIPVPGRLVDVEGDLWWLSMVLQQEYGSATSVPASVPSADPWTHMPRRDRVLTLLALARAHELTADQAATILAITLETLQAQAAEVDLGRGSAPPVWP
ncbi:MAG: hypothetical protein VX265_10030 [Myxococcota bacterium]|nr:hypothetical protein [Myxococcota bacterium]MEC8422616.1 hypothetical protein [Myxococcota bacterium]